MRINFVVSFLELTGGHLAVLEIGNRLLAKGHDVRLVYPERSVTSRRNDLLRRVARVVPDAVVGPAYRRNTSTLDWYDFAGEVVRAQDLDERYVPEGDAVIATAWQTAEAVARFGPRAGRRFYFIQHYETWSGSAARVDATWRQPFVRIASSEWLRELGRARFGIADMYVVPYGVDHATFWPEPRPDGDRRPRVGLLYHTEKWKGVDDALYALERVRSAIPAQAVAFGIFPPGRELPDDVEFHLGPTRDELRRLYSSLDVFLSGSRSDTGPMTVPEAMACGACVVATDVGNVGLWTGRGEGAFVVPPRDRDALARALEHALSDPDERRRRAERGRELIRPFTWERAADAFDDILRRHA